MRPFCTLPYSAFALFEFWTFLLIVFGGANAVYAIYLKKKTHAVCAVISFLFTYFVWQILFDLHHKKLSKVEATPTVSEMSVQLPWLVWILVLALLSLVAASLFIYNNLYRKQSINPMAIKLCADKMPCGICYWRKSGRIILANLCMDRLCVTLTGQPLLNGNIFRKMLSGDVLTVDGKAWRFAYREITLDGEPLYEMIASDITEKHSKTEALEKDAAVLSRIKQELQAYQAGIEESVRRQEILQAKINIHDEMNRLMLSTVVAGNERISELDSVLSLWERNALLLCMEAEGNTKEIKEIKQVAELLNIHLVLPDTLPSALTGQQHELFFSAAQEAIVNAVKHAAASLMTISFFESEKDIRCVLENNGGLPNGEVRFTGGLANLSFLAQKQQATVSVEVKDKFRLILVFPK